MDDVIITTASRQQIDLEPVAREIATEWNIPYVKRKKHSVQSFNSRYNVDNVLVLDHQKNIIWHNQHGAIKYHPGMALIRIKRLISGNNDSMIDLLDIKDDSIILDCTLGLASDAIVAQYVAKEGQVIGLEAERLLALFIKRGLTVYDEDIDSQIKQAMTKIKVIHMNYNEYLQQAPDKSFDIVYFDPMFRDGISLSPNMQMIKTRCCNDAIPIETIEQAVRVARKKVVLKETTYSNEFKRLGFKQIIRPNSSFTYGIIDVEGC
ncbi:class I SAM-dependent methyltransferase [Desulfuribacillus alkaliarsenatis]|uniref:SAM-dependent methyltransferase n=1 Tax=Desulfuribacillus alkaliarsenatis TaxID=766136 RepID=A0A1E5FZK2_9FIRM|nr:class I SAM-dependent methyltransferase [Desulfuribacillus alkaliarsenatis]OEF96007.1 hypothetical protein BHF68_09680 [Desulfuribacillus alkaliarsenatis]